MEASLGTVPAMQIYELTVSQEVPCEMSRDAEVDLCRSEPKSIHFFVVP